MTVPAHPVPPGGTLGILGGGQLGRMLAMAASRLGIRTHIYCPEEDAPARQVAAAFTCASYEDESALTAFAQTAGAISYEFENVPVSAVRSLARLTAVHPHPDILALAQDRLAEKQLARQLGFGTAPFAAIDGPQDIAAALAATGLPAILKTRRMGYDGKGQRAVRTESDCARAFEDLGRVPTLLEGYVTFVAEISVIAARGRDGTCHVFDPAENIHENHILRRTLAPARMDAAVTGRAQDMARAILQSLNYVGVIGVEMFLTQSNTLLINELAPRVHNSGHWTLEACEVSQFEQHVRAVCGWPLGPALRHSDAVMVNLLGTEADDWQALASEGGALHLYGKAEAKEGRKMGHITRLYPLGQRP